MLIKGVRVSIRKNVIPETINPDTLIVTDDARSFALLKERGIDALSLIYSEEDMDGFAGAKYFVMDAFDADYTYYKRVYERIHNIPWEMLHTKRLILRETTEADVDDFYEMYKDPRMTEYMEDLYSNREEEIKYAREYREKVYCTQGFGIWTVVRKSDGKVIGRAGITAREGFLEYEAGFAIGTDYWRMGYATEALEAILSFAKEQNLGALNALIMPGNTASIGLVRKLGFEKGRSETIDGRLYEVWTHH